ncbi:hypothetical protein GVT15_23880 [Salmonella enterica]|nr:hypothetical protein [Salmonella enterica]
MTEKSEELLKKLVHDGLGVNQFSPAFIEAVAIALGYQRETTAEALSRIGDALERIAISLESRE